MHKLGVGMDSDTVEFRALILCRVINLCKICYSNSSVNCRGKNMAVIWTLFKVQFYGRRPLGRPQRRWEDNIKMDL